MLFPELDALARAASGAGPSPSDPQIAAENSLDWGERFLTIKVISWFGRQASIFMACPSSGFVPLNVTAGTSLDDKN